MTLLKHIRAVLLLPFMMTIVIPSSLLYYSNFETIAFQLSPIFNNIRIILSLFLGLIGLTLLIGNIITFAKIGKGTLAPWDPPKNLVITGMYRYVRNPMISGVMFILLSEFLFFFSVYLGIWASTFIIACLIIIPFYEEIKLEQRFGDAYRDYKKQVPRWLPRLK